MKRVNASQATAAYAAIFGLNEAQAIQAATGQVPPLWIEATPKVDMDYKRPIVKEPRPGFVPYEPEIENTAERIKWILCKSAHVTRYGPIVWDMSVGQEAQPDTPIAGPWLNHPAYQYLKRPMRCEKEERGETWKFSDWVPSGPAQYLKPQRAERWQMDLVFNQLIPEDAVSANNWPDAFLGLGKYTHGLVPLTHFSGHRLKRFPYSKTALTKLTDEQASHLAWAFFQIGRSISEHWPNPFTSIEVLYAVIAWAFSSQQHYDYGIGPALAYEWDGKCLFIPQELVHWHELGPQDSGWEGARPVKNNWKYLFQTKQILPNL